MKEKQLRGTAIHYWTNEMPAAPCLFLMHPAFVDHTCFDAQVAYFENRCKVIAMDLIGHGASQGKGTIADTANHVARILEEEGVAAIHLVGISIGAVLAQDFADRYPQRIAALCCIGGYDIHCFDGALQRENSREQRKIMLRAIVSMRRFARANKEISAYTKAGQEAFYRMNLRFPRSSFRHLASLGRCIRRQPARARCYPLWIGVGEHDNEMAKQAAKEWAESEPESRFLYFQGAGHVVNLDVPQAFNQMLETWMQTDGTQAARSERR